MAKVSELQPGDKVTMPGGQISGIFISAAPHPFYLNLELVAWRLSDGSMSLDALDAEQEIGDIVQATGMQRGFHLWVALRGMDRP